MQLANKSGILVENFSVPSNFLDRSVLIDLYLPREVADPSQLNLLLINDGQNLEEMDFASILKELYSANTIQPMLCVGIHAGTERRREYGIMEEPDYKGRGDKAGLYTSFILEELIPVLYANCSMAGFKEKSFAGFSLGGLSALDIVWHHPAEFTKCGLFSASFWWRSLAQEDPEYDDDKHRIMHQVIRKDHYQPGLKFFFQCGNMDETRDRNNNGIIDSIEDTRDIVKELEAKGYKEEEDFIYLEMPDGHHDVKTWGKAMPEFLKWGWGK